MKKGHDVPTELLPSDLFGVDLDPRHQLFIDWVMRARRSLSGQLGRDPSSDYTQSESEMRRASDLRFHYMRTVVDLAEECAIEGLVVPQSGSSSEYQWFALAVERLVTRLRARAALAAPPPTLRLGRKTKGWLRQEIATLMTYVEGTDIEPWRRKKLLASLSDLLRDLDASRLSYAKIMAVLVPLAAVFGSTVTGVAQLPDAGKAIESIHGVIAHLARDHREAEQEQLRLEGPPAALPAPDPRDALADGPNDDGPF